jgi:phage-related baseplate assembly protein
VTIELPEPSFVERDARAILAECIAWYEARTEKPLPGAHPDRIIIELIAYREWLVRVAIQEAAKQNLVRYARFPMLDLLGELLDVPRLEATPATVTLRLRPPSVLGTAQVRAAGAAVRTTDGRWQFTTAADAVVVGGAAYVDVDATCTQAGPGANGYPAGQIRDFVDAADGWTVESVTVTADGSAAEESDAYRARMSVAAHAYSVAGPAGAYRFLALSAHPDVLDVAVSNPEPGVVRVAVLARSGVPPTELLDAVSEFVSDPLRRPLCDSVVVVACEAVDYALTLRVKLKKRYALQREAIVASAAEKANAYAADRAAGLGRHLVAAEASAAVWVAGMYSVTVDAPGDVALAADAWAHCTGVSVAFDGIVDSE